MYTLTAAAITAGVLALTATAMPLNTTESSSIASRDGDTFRIHVWNNCPWTKQFAIYGVDSSFNMIQYTDPVNIKTGHKKIINAPYYGVGLRLSGHAEWGTDGQWVNQALFEFGYSKYLEVEGTSYDVSIMMTPAPGSEPDIGLGAYPIDNGRGSASCRSFTCFPWYCPPDQGWTNPDQINIGSPADTVCYEEGVPLKMQCM
ncbi:hypothetical protein LTR09_003170 [Extremus antarcticus]|uniref:Uncharacterized protein n=1 Tax=Extremus antarcticus TaxID=702011 RepID=A0AAJ0LUS4_9PEZI|nr:hypothetical protein LTR09_003170 [Extremus antarcticus]